QPGAALYGKAGGPARPAYRFSRRFSVRGVSPRQRAVDPRGAAEQSVRLLEVVTLRQRKAGVEPGVTGQAPILSAARHKRISRSSASTAAQAKPSDVSSTSRPSRILSAAAVIVTSRARATRASIESRATRMCSRQRAPPRGPREVAMIVTGL